jgi:putative two-component system response regulator
MARHHHERWDGGGYPDGLAGEAIPWPARLLAVVDTYDSLTSPRPYRPACSHLAASAVIAGERGAQFDPDVTDAFLDCSGDWPAVAQRHG